MKKMLVIIVILSIVFVGMIIYRNNLKSSSSVTVAEVEKIQNYVSKIYMWQEVTEEALPTFDNINDASNLWFWGVIQKNLDNYEPTLEEIQAKENDLFGADLEKQFSKEGTSNFIYNEETQKYDVTGINLDAKEDMFLLNKITNTKNGYEVEIVEYIEDYSLAQSNENDENVENTNNTVIVKNLKNEQISTIANKTEETEIQQIVKDNIDKFSKKKISLKKSENDNLYIVKVENI